MNTFFLTCALTGGAVLVLQLVLGLFGVGDDVDGPGDSAHGGLDLLSVRALAAGATGFGLGGMLGMRTPFGALAGIVIGGILGLAAAVAVAYAMRSMLRLEADGTVQLENALGATADVYLGIPASRQGTGKIHVIVQGRAVEVAAVTAHHEPITTGSRVVVIDIVGSDVVEVAPEAAILPSEVTHVVS